MTANEEQIRSWNEIGGPRWIRLREATTRALVPFGDAAIEALDPRRGEKAIDIGCGMGETTLALAARTGDALGVDVSAPFLEIARKEARDGARYLLADAQTWKFDEKFDLLFSRFGVMFFEDPIAAFRNLRSAANPGARLAMVAWAPWQEVEWATVPMQALRTVYPDAPDPWPGPGPFALAKNFGEVLRAAGFEGVATQRIERPYDADAAQLMELGPAAFHLRTIEAPQEARAKVQREIERLLEGRPLKAAALVATARAPR
jgi:SAM-dependent methyltransferase